MDALSASSRLMVSPANSLLSNFRWAWSSSSWRAASSASAASVACVLPLLSLLSASPPFIILYSRDRTNFFTKTGLNTGFFSSSDSSSESVSYSLDYHQYLFIIYGRKGLTSSPGGCIILAFGLTSSSSSSSLSSSLSSSFLGPPIVTSAKLIFTPPFNPF